MSGLPSVDNNNTPGIKPTASADDISDFLKEDDVDTKVKDNDKEEEKPIKKEPKIKEDKKEEDDDVDDDIKLKEDEEDEDKIDLKEEDEIKIETPPKKKELLKAYPDILEKFPWFDKMMFRDKQYTELFGTIEDAKEIKASAALLDSFEADLSKGDSTSVLKQIKDNSPEVFDKVVDNYLPNLYKVDPDSYYHVTGNVIKHVIKEMRADAAKSKNADLDEAAKLVNKWMFNTEEELKVENKSKEKPVDNDVEKERKEFYQERFETARTDLQAKIDNVLRGTISDYIDPKGEMSPYVKKNAVKDALESLHEQIGKDSNFTKNLDRLWQDVFRQKFSQNSLNSVRSAYLGKSKSLLATVIKLARTEALKGATTSTKKDEEQEEEKSPRRSNVGTPRRMSGNNDRNKMQKGESVHDFFSRD